MRYYYPAFFFPALLVISNSISLAYETVEESERNNHGSLLHTNRQVLLNTTNSSASPLKFQRLQKTLNGTNVFTHLSSQTICTDPLTYHGGPILGRVKVVTIYWGGSSNVPYASELDEFYSAVTNSPWMQILYEYKTPTTSIGMGSLLASYSYDDAPKSAILWDVGIQYRLTTLIRNQLVPQPDANTYYAIHFPPNVVIKGDQDISCETFCAYHGSFSYESSMLAYGVMPTCSDGCGRDSIQLNNLYSVASHELSEAVTNPTGSTAWISPTCDEIADMCNHMHDMTVGSNGQRYMIQKLWSNKYNECIGNAPSNYPTLKPTSTVSNCYDLTVTLLTDNRGYQTWLYVVDLTLSSSTSKEVIVWNTSSQKLVLRTQYSGTSCFDKTHCYSVSMMDKGGDGMCCSRGKGWYEISWNGTKRLVSIHCL